MARNAIINALSRRPKDCAVGGSSVQELLDERPQRQAFDENPVRAERTRLPLQMQSVLDALRPTDNPERLGRLGGYEVSGVVGSGAMGVRQWHLQTDLPPDAILSADTVFVGDTEGDGRVRAVVASMCHVWYLDPNEGKVLSHTTWQPEQAMRSHNGWNELIDVDGDGRLDYVNVSSEQHVDYVRNSGMKMELAWTRGWRDNEIVKQAGIACPPHPFRDLDGDGSVECVISRMDHQRNQWELSVLDGKSGRDIVKQSNIVPLATMRAGADRKSGYLLLCARTQGPDLEPTKGHEIWTFRSGKLQKIWSSEQDGFLLQKFEHGNTNTGYYRFRFRKPVTRDVDGDGAAEFFTLHDGDEYPRGVGL